MKQKSNFTFLLSYAKNEKYKLYIPHAVRYKIGYY